MKHIRVTTIAGILSVFCVLSASGQSRPPSEVLITPFAGLTANRSAGADVNGPVAGGELAWRRGNILWTPLEISAQFPQRGGYVRLAAGAAFVGEAGHYAGFLVGVSRFTPNQFFATFRAGVALPLPLAPVLEARIEGHDRRFEGGSAFSIIGRVPIRVY